MADKELKSINDICTKEFPDTRSFDDISAKLDTLNNHPHMQQLRHSLYKQKKYLEE